MTDNRKFWKTVKLPFSYKISHNDTVLSDDQIVGDTFNNYFNNNLLTLINKNFPNK